MVGVQQAQVRSFKGALRVGLHESLWALEEAFTGLKDEQLWTPALEGHHCIGVLILHLQQNIDMHACWKLTGKWVLSHDETVCDLWKYRAVRDLHGTSGLHTMENMQTRHRVVAAAALANLEAIPEEELALPGPTKDTDWAKVFGRNVAELFARVTHHTNGHVRQIWVLRGARGWGGWPVQHYH